MAEHDTRSGIHLRNRESAELTHSLAPADRVAESFDLSWVGEPGSLGGLLNAENPSTVLGPRTFGNCEDPPRLT